MTAFYLENFGCRATQADAAAIERQLLDRGYRRAGQAGGAELVVVNTCTVTASADAQARQAIRALHRENPAAHILVTGCYAQRAPEELARLEGVAWVVGNSHKPAIPSLIEGALGGPDFFPLAQLGTAPLAQLSSEPLSLERGPAKILTGNIFEQTAVMVAPVLGGEGEHTRPVLKIQDGCNHRCAYCVIPFVRGRSRSLPPEQVLEEIRRLAGAGYREVVLSGINLGSYGRDLVPRVEFADLLSLILDETALARLRVSSIEPMDVTEDLVRLFASTDRFARHFHIPLQSGSDPVLAAMHRWYRAAHYARRLELIQEHLPGSAIGADVIAGFPGETEEDHRTTLAFLEQLPFTYLHVFTFSKRPGTKAAAMSGEVPPTVVQRRSRELRALGAQKNAAFRATHLQRTLRVLTLSKRLEEDVRWGGALNVRAEALTPYPGEAGSGIWTEALSDNYLKVRVAGSWPANRLLDVRIIADAGAHLLARPC